MSVAIDRGPHLLAPVMFSLFTVIAAVMLLQGVRSGRMSLILAPTLAVARHRTPGTFWICATINGLSAVGGAVLAVVLWLQR